MFPHPRSANTDLLFIFSALFFLRRIGELEMKAVEIPEWNKKLLIGNEMIDQQHRSIFDLAQALADEVGRCDIEDWGKTCARDFDREDALVDAVYALSDYVIEHFEDEESLMSEEEYPGLAAHRIMHNEIGERVLGYTARFMVGGEVPPDRISQFIAEWLKHHILEEDLRFIEWLDSRG